MGVPGQYRVLSSERECDEFYTCLATGFMSGVGNPSIRTKSIGYNSAFAISQQP